MKFRLLWVDDQATFAKSGKTEEWPTMLLSFLREDALPDTNCYFGPVTDGGRTVPASYMDIWFASSFPRALDLIPEHEFDAAILDMRMPVGGSDHEAIKKYLKLKGRTLPDSLSIDEEMSFGFWLWREVKTASPNALVVFYTNYSNIGREAFVYHPFMNPDPHTQLSPAIHEKNASSLGKTFVRYLDNRARAALKYNDPGLISELARALTQNSICGNAESLIMEEKLFLSDDHATKVSLADLFPSFAFAVASGFATEDEERRRVLQILEQALGRHEQCAVFARLLSPRNLDWDDRPTYGIQLVRDLEWAKQITAWPDVGYSPLEMLSHGRTTNRMTDGDRDAWNRAKHVAQSQVRQVASYSQDKKAVASLMNWADFCADLPEPFLDSEIPTMLDCFKGLFRWTPAQVLEDIAKPKSGNWSVLGKCEHTISGYSATILSGINLLAADLGHNEIDKAIVGSGGRTQPRKCWLFLAGEPHEDREWPHNEEKGNKIFTALDLLAGYLICYQFRLSEEVFEWRPLRHKSEHLHRDERAEIEGCINKGYNGHALVGYGLVLPNYPARRTR